MNQAIQRLSELWHSLTTTRYTRFLEEENERLLQENRALMNSLLTRAGVQPIDPPKPVPRVGRHMSRNQFQVGLEREWAAKNKKPD